MEQVIQKKIWGKKVSKMRVFTLFLLIAVFLTALASASIFFNNNTAKAATVSGDGTTLTLDQNEDFVITNNALTALSPSAINKINTINNPKIIVTIPSGVTSIGSSAFYNCSGLTSITLPSGLTSIGSSAFSGCSGLTSITLPSGLTSIDYSAFYDCSGLTSIEIPEGVTSINYQVFYGCSGLTSIEIPSGVTSIVYQAFGCCYSLIEVCNNSSLNITKGGSDNGYVGYYAKNIYSSASGRSNLSEVDDYVFYSDTANGNLLVKYKGSQTELTLPDKFNGENYKIHNYAFDSNKTLTSITIPEGVTSIGSSAFSNCSGLTSITVSESDSNYCSVDGILYDKAKTQIVAVPLGISGSITIPEGVTSIGSSAFYNCSGLTSITLPSGLTSIGSYAFYNCSGLTSIEIPEGVTSIGYAFYNCSNLASIYYTGDIASWCAEGYSSELMAVGRKLYINGAELTGELVIPEGVTSIGEKAFAYQTGITSVTVPNSVTSIGAGAFAGCSGLTSMTLPFVGYGRKTASNAYQYPFGYIFGTSSYTGGVATSQNYYGSSTSSTTSSTYYIPSSLKSVTITGGNILYGAFYNCSGLTSIEIPSSVTSIGSSAFYGCSGLTSIEIPSSVTSIGISTFGGCSGLTSITLPSGLRGIDMYAFYNCSGLTSIEIPSGLTGISSDAFSGCSGLTSITLPSGLTSIGSSAFYGCSGLTSITLPSSVTNISNYAFRNCNNLSAIYLGKGVCSWSAGSLKGVAAQIVMPNIEEYLAAKNNASLRVEMSVSGYGTVKCELTYQIDVKLHNINGEEDNVTTKTCLYGKPYNLTKQQDGSWITDNTTEVPLLQGYSLTKWYDNADFSGEHVNINNLLAKKATESADTLIDGFDLYALFVSQRGVDGLVERDDLTYTGEEFIEVGLNNIVSASKFATLLKDNDLWESVKENVVVTLKEYKNAMGQVATTLPDKFLNAGTYSLEVTLQERYGVWATPVKFSVVINRKAIDLYEDENCRLVIESESGDIPLVGENESVVYVYSYKYDGATKTYPSLTKLSAMPKDLADLGGSEWKLEKEVTLVRGYTRYSKNSDGNDVSVTLKLAEVAKFEAVTYTNNVADGGIGEYTTSVRVETNNNHVLVKSVDANSVAMALKRQLSISVSDDGTTATVSKIWYILARQSYLTSGTQGKEYTTFDFAFGSNKVIDAPTLSAGNIEEVTFVLKRNGEVIPVQSAARGVSEANYADFAKYVNGTMPAGKYTIVFNVPEFTTEEGVIPAFSSSYEFNVTPGGITVDDSELNGQTFTAEYVKGIDIFKYIEKLDITSTNVTRTGVWADSRYNDLYSEVKPTFSLARMYDGEYHDADEFKQERLAKLITAGPNATYTVYYKLSASNCVDSVTGNDRFTSFYRVILYSVLTAPQVSGATYNGSRLSPVIASNESYSVVYPENTTEAGEYEVVYALYDTVHYRWSKTEGVTIDEERGMATVKYTIAKADNTWLRIPNIVGWTFGEFNADVNRIRAVAKFAQSTIKFGIVKGDGTEVAGLSEFTVDANGMVDTSNENLLNALKTLPTGSYKLCVWVDSTSNYAELVENIDFTVDIAVNVWQVIPNVISWNFASYDKNTNLLLGTSQFGEIKYTVTTDAEGQKSIEGLKDFTVVNGVVSDSVAEKLAALTTGTYYLGAKVLDTSEYSGLNPAPTRFAIGKAINAWSNNSDDLALPGWIVGRYNEEVNVISVKALYGDVNVVVEDANGTEFYNSLTGVNRLNECKVGKYLLKAWVVGSDNFTGLEERTFTIEVFKKVGLPWWAVLCITASVVLVCAGVIFILWKRGVFEFLTGRIIVAIRTRASIDATIASVRAAMKTEESRRTVAEAERLEAEEAAAKAAAENNNEKK